MQVRRGGFLQVGKNIGMIGLWKHYLWRQRDCPLAAMTRRGDGKRKKLLVIDARKAHLNSKCEEDVYVKLPEECRCPEGMCAKLKYWLYGFRKAATAWEDHYSKLFESVGFQRGGGLWSCVLQQGEGPFDGSAWR